MEEGATAVRKEGGPKGPWQWASSAEMQNEVWEEASRSTSAVQGQPVWELFVGEVGPESGSSGLQSKSKVGRWRRVPSGSPNVGWRQESSSRKRRGS